MKISLVIKGTVADARIALARHSIPADGIALVPCTGNAVQCCVDDASITKVCRWFLEAPALALAPFAPGTLLLYSFPDQDNDLGAAP